MTSPEPDLSPAERAMLRDIEVRLAAQDPALARALRAGTLYRLSSPARLAALLLAGSVVIGVASLAGGGQAALAAALGVLGIAIGVNLNHLRRA